eukprot:TRINITY_DN2012_c1_g3_i1.p1 TRINITY_DN2012_c1_g3~~TRINITY_DN2012_c1_g3_i1.p1  ORF type:complete len:720 (+),score=153.92 TRINITY_DN2012_c1_g3_i1:47-2161(+)
MSAAGSQFLPRPPLPGSIPLPEGDLAEVNLDALRTVIENGFNRQRDWLDKQLQHHERLLQQISARLATAASQGPAQPLEERRPSFFSDAAVTDVGGPEYEVLGLRTSSRLEPLRQAASTDSIVELHSRQEDWRSQLMSMFDELDLDCSGTINRAELRKAFVEVGAPDIGAIQTFVQVDTSKNDEIDRLEWLHMIEDASTGEDADAFALFAEKLFQRHAEKGRLYDVEATSKYSMKTCYIRHDAPYRMVWDMLMMVLLAFVGLSLPYTMGFGPVDALADIDRVCDVLFLVDVLLNFRTTYTDREETIVTNGRKMALHYLKTWFLLDFLSSVPWDSVTAGILPSLQGIRLLKVGKIAKVFKLLRLGKMIRALAGSELLEWMEDQFSPKFSQTMGRVVNLIVVTGVTCHWLACFLAICDSGSLDDYLQARNGSTDDPAKDQRYLAALYWAVTTLTTVGYGDIIPKTDSERMYAMLAMMIGSAFYGYIIGCITSVITDADIERRTFNERMEVVQAWLDFHERMPAILRRRIRRHFKEHFRDKPVADDATIVSDLSGMLRADTAYFIIHEKVRSNPVFSGLPNSALANLLCCLKKTHAKNDENLVMSGDPGTAMYVIIEGQAQLSVGKQWLPPDRLSTDDNASLGKDLKDGDSFGEEIIFSLEATYQYTIVAKSAISMYELSKDAFKDCFRNMPELLQQMCSKFLKSRK